MISLPQLPSNGDALCSPNEAAEQLTGRPHVTYSELSSFQRCPLQWYYTYVLKLEPEQISAALVLGSAVHHGIERYLEAEMAADDPPTLDQMMESYRNCWETETKDKPVQFPQRQDAQALEAQVRSMFEAFLGSEFAAPEGEIIGIEESFKITLDESLPDLAGRVDVLTYKDGVLTVTDYKTARSMWNAKTAQENSEQLVLYSQGVKRLAEELGAKEIALEFVILTKAKQPKIEALPVKVDPDRLQRSKQVIKQVVTAMGAGVIYPAPSQMHCCTCPHQERCKSWHHH